LFPGRSAWSRRKAKAGKPNHLGQLKKLTSASQKPSLPPHFFEISPKKYPVVGIFSPEKSPFLA